MVAKQAGIDMESVLPMKENIRSIAEDYNLAPQDKDDNEDIVAAKAELRSQLQTMLERQQGVLGWSQQAWGEQPQGWQPAESAQPLENMSKPAPKASQTMIPSMPQL